MRNAFGCLLAAASGWPLLLPGELGWFGIIVLYNGTKLNGNTHKYACLFTNGLNGYQTYRLVTKQEGI
jgi:hypothetical protein